MHACARAHTHTHIRTHALTRTCTRTRALTRTCATRAPAAARQPHCGDGGAECGAPALAAARHQDLGPAPGQLVRVAHARACVCVCCVCVCVCMHACMCVCTRALSVCACVRCLCVWVGCCIWWAGFEQQLHSMTPLHPLLVPNVPSCSISLHPPALLRSPARTLLNPAAPPCLRSSARTLLNPAATPCAPALARRYCVAWYPAYRIPDAPLNARFLTFHSFAPLVTSIQVGVMWGCGWWPGVACLTRNVGAAWWCPVMQAQRRLVPVLLLLPPLCVAGQVKA